MFLAKLPKAFGLTELKKGYFPHLFNKTENRDYVGPLPLKLGTLFWLGTRPGGRRDNSTFKKN